MKTHTGAARILALPALAALLALLGGACAGAAGGARSAYDPHTTPKITINTLIKNRHGNYRKSYGEDILLHCSAKDITHLKMDENRKSLQIMEVNTTTVQLCLNKPKLGKYTYSCMDDKTGWEDSVTVEVIPAMSVVSSRVHTHSNYIYIVPLGELYEVFCSGPDSEALIMESFKDTSSKRLIADVINSTLIKHRTQADRIENRYYGCSGKTTATGEEDKMNEVINVKIDYYPKCLNFSCVIYTYYFYTDAHSVIECAWNYSTDIIRFQLFYTDLTEGYGETTLLCGDKSGNMMTGACKVDEASTERTLFYMNHNVSLLLMSCNSYFCNNESIVTNTAAIAKVKPVYDLKVLSTSAHGVALTWTNGYPYANLARKVEYRQVKFNHGWRLAESLSLRCEYWTCECRLALPYPDAEYEVRVYARHETATDDRVWSEPKYISVTTKPRVEECACSAAPDTPVGPTTISAETASCEVCTDMEDTIKESLALKNKISSLKVKLAKVNRYVKLSKLEEAANELNAF